METYLLQLDLIDGAGRLDQTKYYLIDCKSYPVDHCKLEDDVLEELRKLYPNDNKINNSGYHDWSVVSLGSRSIMERVYQQYQDTKASMKFLKRFGFLF